MLKIDLDDTIVAIATPIGEGGIGIVRLSGKGALSIADRLFVSKDGGRPSDYKAYTTHYGQIIDPGPQTPSLFSYAPPLGGASEKLFQMENISAKQNQRFPLDLHNLEPRTPRPASCPACRGGHNLEPRTYNLEPKTYNLEPKIIDEVILTVMRAPKSYTKEDVVEINCHGGTVPLRRTLEAALNLGARLAEPGEFTKRAFLNGRIDLAQAEAVLDIVKAKTSKSLDAALAQLEGGLSRRIKEMREKLLDLKAHLEAAIDFPDDDIAPDSGSKLSERLHSMEQQLLGLIKSSEAGRVVREGINCVICGKPNAGKSSLMNALLREERVIVTPLPGTTRDAVSEFVNIEGLPVNVIDTAGITKTKDTVEKEGIIRSKLYLNRADLILFVADLGTGLTTEDKEIIQLIKDKEAICVLNKMDIEPRKAISAPELNRHFGKEVRAVEISALKDMNLDVLRRHIHDKVFSGGVSADDYNILINARHRDSLVKALGSVREAVSSSDASRPEEVISISIGEAVSALGEVTGEAVSEEVLNRIFSRFCVGK